MFELEYTFTISVKIAKHFYPDGTTPQDAAEIEVANINEPTYIPRLFYLNNFHADIKVKDASN